MEMRKKYFITSVGTTDYGNTTYIHNGKFFETKFASEAIYRLVDGITDAEVFVFSTDEAIKKYGNDLKKLINAKCISVPFAKEEKELWNVFEQINKQIETGAEIIIDITNAFRSLQMIYFAIIVYLTALKNVTIKGIYYGAYEDKDKSSDPPKTPVVDLTAIFNMIDWFYAVRIFNDYGLAKPVATIIDEVVKKTGNQYVKDDLLKDVSGKLKNISDGLYNVDIRIINDYFYKLINKKDEYSEALSNNLPIGKEAFNIILNSYQGFGINQRLIQKNNNYTDLTREELEREKIIIDWYLARGQVKNGLTLIREWIVNQFMLHKKRTEKWLVRNNRELVESIIRDLIKNKKHVSSELKDIAEKSEKIFSLRNRMSHGGFTCDEISCSEVEKIWQYFKGFDWSQINNFFFNGKKEIKTLYVTSLGLSKGVLYTLLENVTQADTPCHFLLITSDETRKSIPECLTKAGLNVSYTCWNLADPHKDDFDKRKFMNTSDYIDLINKSEKIIINFAGGTSAMQFHVKGIAEIAESYAINVTKILTIDRRSSEEQRNDPFVKGEIIKI